MSTKESTEMKAGLKKLPARKKKKKRKPGSGGARPGAGRKSVFGETKQVHFDFPLPILKAFELLKIENKTAFVLNTIAKELSGNQSNKLTNKLIFELNKIKELTAPAN